MSQVGQVEVGQPPIVLPGEGPPTALSPVDVDVAVEQLASSVRRISQEQDNLFSIFRGNELMGGGHGGEKNKDGDKKTDGGDRNQTSPVENRRTEGASKEDTEEGKGQLQENLESVEGDIANGSNKMQDKCLGESTNGNAVPEGKTHLPKEPTKPSEHKSERKEKKDKEIDEKKTKKRKPPLFVEIPSVGADVREMGKDGEMEDAEKEKRWTVNIPIIRMDQQGGKEERHGVTDPTKERESRKITFVNIPILRSDQPEREKLENTVGAADESECNNDDGLGHNCSPTNSDALVSKEMRSVISKLRQVQGELEMGVEEKAEKVKVNQSEGESEKITPPSLDNVKTGEKVETLSSDTEGEDYIEATGPSQDSDQAGENEKGQMSPLVSQIVQIRQFIQNFRRSIQDTRSVSNNSETVEVTEKRLKNEGSSPRREGSLFDWDERSEDQNQLGLFWASPALVKEEGAKKESEKMDTHVGGEQERTEDVRSGFLILPSSPKVASPVIYPKRKASVTSQTTKKVSVMSPDWKTDNHHTFVHLI